MINTVISKQFRLFYQGKSRVQRQQFQKFPLKLLSYYPKFFSQRSIWWFQLPLLYLKKPHLFLITSFQCDLISIFLLQILVFTFLWYRFGFLCYWRWSHHGLDVNCHNLLYRANQINPAIIVWVMLNLFKILIVPVYHSIRIALLYWVFILFNTIDATDKQRLQLVR